MASICDSCMHLLQRVNGRQIRCYKRGGPRDQRLEKCSKYAMKGIKRKDMLDWCGV